jgi:hypothetical protein
MTRRQRTDQPEHDPRSWLRHHSLGLTLVAVFAAFTTATLILGWHEYTAEQTAHGQPPDQAGFWVWWTFEYAMSLVADVFGLVLIVFLTKRLYELGSAESK